MLGGAAVKIQAAREKLANYVNANKQDVSLVENCTAATTAAIRAASIRSGDAVIHLSTAYGMVKNCLAHAAAPWDAEVIELPVEFRGQGSAPCAPGGVDLASSLASAMDDAAARGRRIALVTFDYIASCPGALMPIHAMARECKSRGVPVLLDGAHVLGQIRLDCGALEASGVTYFMADAHKWLFSPKGSAMLWVTKAAQANCFPSVVGAVCSNSPSTNFNPAVLAGLSEYERRFQYTGTRDYTPLIAVHDALLWREKIGESAILGYNRGMAVWAQEWLAAVWKTETLVPEECTAFMAHARVPVESSAAALLMNRMLKEDCSIHIMAFSLPPRKHLGETAPTHWVRPCIQLFVHREDIRALGAAVLRLKIGVDTAAKVGTSWLAKTRARRRAASEAETAKTKAKANVLGGDATGAHKVTVGFSVVPPPPRFSRQDSAQDLTTPTVGTTAIAADANVAVVAKYSAAQQIHAPRIGHHFQLPALPEDHAEQTPPTGTSSLLLADSFQEMGMMNDGGGGGGVNGMGSNIVAGNNNQWGVTTKGGVVGAAVKGGVHAVGQSPVSIMDLGDFSVGSSASMGMGNSVDGAGFVHPDWFKLTNPRTPMTTTGYTTTAQ